MRRAFASGRAVPFGVVRLCLSAVVALVLLASQSPPCEAPGAALRLPAARVFADQDGSPGPVVFSHTTHVELGGGGCLSCHPSPFSILGRHEAVSHEQMEAGRACGICHDGNAATGVDDPDACMHCHDEGGSR